MLADVCRSEVAVGIKLVCLQEHWIGGGMISEEIKHHAPAHVIVAVEWVVRDTALIPGNGLVGPHLVVFLTLKTLFAIDLSELIDRFEIPRFDSVRPFE